jgi:saccharopine dehydrogenase (NAD+, L-lysine-forming)
VCGFPAGNTPTGFARIGVGRLFTVRLPSRRVRVLVVGAGGVGSAFVTIASRREVIAHITVADVNLARAEFAASTASRNERGDRVDATTVDARSAQSVADLAVACGADVVLNACDPRYNPGIFDGAFMAGINYIDMAMHLSVPHAERPFSEIGVLLGEAQLAVSDRWAERGQLALVAMGV